jgi:hypothetical protein
MTSIPCANPDCRKVFKPQRGNQKYCSKECRGARWDLEVPVKRIRRDEVGYLKRRRKRQEANSAYVTELLPPTVANPFQAHVLAAKRVMQLRTKCDAEMMKMGFFGTNRPLLPPLSPGDTPTGGAFFDPFGAPPPPAPPAGGDSGVRIAKKGWWGRLWNWLRQNSTFKIPNSGS